jgi:hypothetical protein
MMKLKYESEMEALMIFDCQRCEDKMLLRTVTFSLSFYVLSREMRERKFSNAFKVWQASHILSHLVDGNNDSNNQKEK